MIDMNEIMRLRRLLAKTKPGGWETARHPGTMVLIRRNNTWSHGSVDNLEDAVLIVAMRNALPDLLDAAERASRARGDKGDGLREVQLKPGWLAHDVAAASARLQPKGGDANANLRPRSSVDATSPGVTAGASAGWQSIETAPRDGTRFLTWDSYYGVRMGRAFMRADHDDWLSYVDSNGSPHKGGIRASHWMPLPAVPVDGGEDA